MKKERNDRKFVRYKEGAEIYGIGFRQFQDLAKEAHAIYKVGKMVLVRVAVLDEYLESFRQ